MSDLSVVRLSSCNTEVPRVREACGALESRSAETKPAELWLCIDLPRLPIDAVSIGQIKPAVVVKQKAGRIGVLDCNQAACLEGIRPGMPLAAALSLQQDLSVYQHQPDAEQQQLIRLADWSLAFSDRVALYGNHSVMVGIQGSLRLFGGLSELLRRMTLELEDFGPDFSVALAPSPRAAYWLAQSGTGQIVQNIRELASVLRSLPVSKVTQNARQLARMQRSGIRTLADLMRLSRDGLARRFGVAILEALDLALARKPETVNLYSPSGMFFGEQVFYQPMSDLNLIRPAANVLLQNLECYLTGRQSTTRLFHCKLMRNSEPQVQIEIGCRRPTYRARQLMLLLEEHLCRIQLETDVTSIVVSCADFEVFVADQSDLFEPRLQESQSWFGFIEQLEARLGKAALKQFLTDQDHRPERACSEANLELRRPTLNVSGRPLWLLETPEVLSVRHGRPCWRGPLDRFSVSERIQQGWWDGFDIGRDYCIAENPEGSRLWIYRDLYRNEWFLHGVFA